MISSSDITSLSFRRLVEDASRDGRHTPIVMQIVPALNSGGVEQGVVDINAAVIKAGGESIVVSSGGVRVHEITKAGGAHIALPVDSKNPMVMANNVGRLRKIIRELNVDIVHACSRAPAWSAVKAVEGTSARYITSCHAAHKITGSLKRLYNSSITKGELVISVSNFLADYLEQGYQVDPQRIRVVHRGVGLGKFHPNAVTPERLIGISQAWRLPEGASIVMLPGRITRSKGHMFFLDAIAQLQKQDLFCLFVGSDIGNENYRKELEEYIADKDMGSMVRIVTDCKDMPAAYMLSTVVVCPSLTPEGFGRVPIEAQAMGRPVIVTNHGGLRESVIANETGWLVEPGDVDELSRALHEALTLDDSERSMLATRGMSHVAQLFTNAQMCAGTLDVYAELLGNVGFDRLSSREDLLRAVG